MTHDNTVPPPTVLDVGALLEAPGATRPVELDVPVPEDFEIALTQLEGEVAIDGVLESLVDGILLRGTVAVAVAQQCAACLEPVPRDRVSAEVAELFSDPSSAEDPDDIDDGYEITRAQTIDLDAMIRDVLAAAVPSAPHCREGCKGLCPTCGTNLNDHRCDCVDDVTDDRWAALAELDLST